MENHTAVAQTPAIEPVVKDLYTRAVFPGRLLMLGCGSIGKAILPMLLRHTDITPERIRILTSDDSGKHTAADAGIEFVLETLTSDTYASILKKNLKEGDFLLNLSVDVSSPDLIVWCQKHGVLYVDTSTERWPGFSTDASLSIVDRTNYTEREQFVELKKKHVNGLTAVVNHGANPGLISHFLKAALLDIARDIGNGAAALGTPKDSEGWAKLMQDLKVRTIQVAERDTQLSPALNKQTNL